MILYRTADSGEVTALGFCESDYVPKSDETMIEGDLLPEIETLHEQKYLDVQALVKYKEDRRAEYPPMGDQLDMMYKDTKNSTTTHADAVEAVKTKWPKDNSGPVE